MIKRFTRNKEDFTCEHCRAEVVGTGYTNHCPKCLWSKHVDKNPGDRLEACDGAMEPMRVEGTTPNYTIVHQCKVCKLERRNKVQAEDMPETVVALASKATTRSGRTNMV